MPEKLYAVILSKDMRHPIYILCKDIIEFSRKLQDIMMEHGEIELMYRVY